MSRRVDQVIRDEERRERDADARRMFEEDVPGWLTWESVSEEMRQEYRRLALAERKGTS